jgi:hypothetical protein
VVFEVFVRFLAIFYPFTHCFARFFADFPSFFFFSFLLVFTPFFSHFSSFFLIFALFCSFFTRFLLVFHSFFIFLPYFYPIFRIFYPFLPYFHLFFHPSYAFDARLRRLLPKYDGGLEKRARAMLCMGKWVFLRCFMVFWGVLWVF